MRFDVSVFLSFLVISFSCFNYRGIGVKKQWCGAVWRKQSLLTSLPTVFLFRFFQGSGTDSGYWSLPFH